VMKSIELLGTKVIPELKRRGAHRAAGSVAASIESVKHAPRTQNQRP